MDRKLGGLIALVFSAAVGAESNTGTYRTFVDASQLRALIESGHGPDEDLAMGYVLGFLDASEMHHFAEPKAIRQFCMPQMRSQDAYEKIAATIREMPPLKKDVGAALLVTLAIELSWPCPK